MICLTYHQCQSSQCECDNHSFLVSYTSLHIGFSSYVLDNLSSINFPKFWGIFGCPKFMANAYTLCIMKSCRWSTCRKTPLTWYSVSGCPLLSSLKQLCVVNAADCLLHLSIRRRSHLCNTTCLLYSQSRASHCCLYKFSPNHSPHITLHQAYFLYRWSIIKITLFDHEILKKIYYNVGHGPYFRFVFISLLRFWL